MVWTNQKLILYNGTDDDSANSIIQQGIQTSLCKVLTDFGQGFYLTTYLHQAKNWANVRCRLLQRALNSKRPRAPSSSPKIYVATVLRFEVSREEIALPEVLVFITEGSNPDYWDLVSHCRQGGSGCHRLRGGLYYDMVYGPVSLWPQTLVIKDCDQISFHNRRSVDILDQARSQRPYAQGSPLF